VTVAESSTVLEHKQRSCEVQSWKCGRLALANRHEWQNVHVSGGDLKCCNWNAQLLEVLQSALMATLIEDDRAELENYPLLNWQPVKIISSRSVGVMRSDFFRIISRVDQCKIDWRFFVAVVFIC